MRADEIIEAMARAMFKDDQTCRLEIAKAIFEVCKPIIAAQERERIASKFDARPHDFWSGEAVAAAIRETGDEGI